jgi:hypothetical protein
LQAWVLAEIGTAMAVVLEKVVTIAAAVTVTTVAHAFAVPQPHAADIALFMRALELI